MKNVTGSKITNALVQIIILLTILPMAAWAQNSNAVIQIKSHSPNDIEDAKQEILGKGGQIRVITTSGKIIAYLPDKTKQYLMGIYDIEPFIASPLTGLEDSSLAQGLDAITSKAIEGANEDFPAPQVITSTPRADRITSSYMMGSCRVDLVLAESVGSTLNWSVAEKNNAIDQVEEALNWWAERAAEHSAPMIFVLNDTPYIAAVADEPIYQNSGLFYLWNLDLVDWMEDAIADIGYGTTNWDGIFDLVNDKRSESKTDWGFTIFLVDNTNDNDIVKQYFEDDVSAYTMMWTKDPLFGIDNWYGGPAFISRSMGTLQNWKTYAHEMGHIFGALDEYSPSIHCLFESSCNELGGYLLEENGNCVLCANPWDECIMTSTNWSPSDPSSFLCNHTPIQLGWRDSDGDGPMDPIDPNTSYYTPILGVYPGDRVKIYDEAGNLFQSIAVTNDNILPYTGPGEAIIWDGSYIDNSIVAAPGVYIYVINSQPEEGFVYGTSTSQTPVLSNVQTFYGGFNFTLSEDWAHVRALATSISNGEKYFVLSDKMYWVGTYEVAIDLPPDAYSIDLFAWRPDNHNSNTIVFSYPPENLTLENLSIGTTEVYVATNSITAGPNFTVESTGDVTFQAGNIITLKPGFTATAGSKFHAYIDTNLGGGSQPMIAAAIPEVRTIEEQTADEGADEAIPTVFSLSHNYPNPFNPVTTIRFGLPEAMDVKFVVYDLLGREVDRLADRYLEPGYYQVVWQGRDAAGREVPSGIYIARMVTRKYTKSIKMLLLK